MLLIPPNKRGVCTIPSILVSSKRQWNSSAPRSWPSSWPPPPPPYPGWRQRPPGSRTHSAATSPAGRRAWQSLGGPEKTILPLGLRLSIFFLFSYSNAYSSVFRPLVSAARDLRANNPGSKGTIFIIDSTATPFVKFVYQQANQMTRNTNLFVEIITLLHCRPWLPSSP